MNNEKLKACFRQIDFTSRYQRLCGDHNNIEDSMSGNHPERFVEIVNSIEEDFVYNKKESFFRKEYKTDVLVFGVQLSLRNGLVECSFDFLTKNGYIGPDGRLDFIPQSLGEDFDRMNYNLPKYRNFEELKKIVEVLIEIVSDLNSSLNKT